MNIKIFLKDVVGSDDLVFGVEPLTLCIIFKKKCFLFHILRLLDLFHIQPAKVLLNENCRYETDKREANPEHEAVHVVNALWCILSESLHELYMAESEQLIDNIHHADTLDLAHRIDYLSCELIAGKRN